MGKNDVRTAIQQFYPPPKTFIPPKQISGYAPASFLQFGREKAVPLATPAKYSRVIGRVHIVGYYRPRKVYIVARTNRSQYLAQPISRAGEVTTARCTYNRKLTYNSMG